MTHGKFNGSLITLATTLLLFSCGENKSDQEAPKGPIPFQVFAVETQTTTLFTDYPATIQGEEDIEIRPKIDGYIDAVLIEEGQFVKKGQTLFKISNPLYEQTARNAAAAVELAETEVENAQLQYNKTKPLVDKGIVSNFDLESARLNLKAKQAALMQARANLANARVNVGYTTIKSPFNGVVGTLNYKLGSYVNNATVQPLTVVSNIQKVYAYFGLSEKEQLDFVRNTSGKTLQDKIKQLPEVTLILADGTEYAQKGKVETFSGVVSASTGSFNVRAGFTNPNTLLRSGNSGKIRLKTSINNAIVIPQSATYELQGKRFVYVVQGKQTVTAKEITVREIPGGQLFVVDKGLQTGDQIVSEGIQQLSEGMKIIPKPVAFDQIIQENALQTADKGRN